MYRHRIRIHMIAVTLDGDGVTVQRKYLKTGVLFSSLLYYTLLLTLPVILIHSYAGPATRLLSLTPLLQVMCPNSRAAQDTSKSVRRRPAMVGHLKISHVPRPFYVLAGLHFILRHRMFNSRLLACKLQSVT